MSLSQLEEQIRLDLQLTRYPERDWLAARSTKDGEHIYDVGLVGGGQVVSQQQLCADMGETRAANMKQHASQVLVLVFDAARRCEY
ncbi:MAG: hypothetical protein GY822_03290 [Deltaproteobacteria bacterium]|nr:hypothetical protein [Deltaproteobacteria bacterium]